MAVLTTSSATSATLPWASIASVAKRTGVPLEQQPGEDFDAYSARLMLLADTVAEASVMLAEALKGRYGPERCVAATYRLRTINRGGCCGPSGPGITVNLDPPADGQHSILGVHIHRDGCSMPGLWGDPMPKPGQFHPMQFTGHHFDVPIPGDNLIRDVIPTMGRYNGCMMIDEPLKFVVHPPGEFAGPTDDPDGGFDPAGFNVNGVVQAGVRRRYRIHTTPKDKRDVEGPQPSFCLERHDRLRICLPGCNSLADIAGLCGCGPGCQSSDPLVTVIYHTSGNLPPGTDRMLARLVSSLEPGLASGAGAVVSSANCDVPSGATSVSRQGISWQRAQQEQQSKASVPGGSLLPESVRDWVSSLSVARVRISDPVTPKKISDLTVPCPC
jgi:hypothetical protein